MLRWWLALVLGAVVAVPAAAVQINAGQLRVVRAARGTINLDSGLAAFRINGWEIIPPSNSNGIDPGTEPVTVAIGDTERFLIPPGEMKVLHKGKRFLYSSKTDRGIQLLKLAWTPAGTMKMTLKISGVDMSELIIKDPPICVSMAIIIGDDDGFSGVSFDRPKPFPSKLLTIPGFCTPLDWPWA